MHPDGNTDAWEFSGVSVLVAQIFVTAGRLFPSQWTGGKNAVNLNTQLFSFSMQHARLPFHLGSRAQSPQIIISPEICCWPFVSRPGKRNDTKILTVGTSLARPGRSHLCLAQENSEHPRDVRLRGPSCCGDLQADFCTWPHVPRARFQAACADPNVRLAHESPPPLYMSPSKYDGSFSKSHRPPWCSGGTGSMITGW